MPTVEREDAHRRVMAERDDTAFEMCQIVFWRGYVKCAFYAVPEGGDPIGSPFFRSRERQPTRSGSPLEAHGALVQRLEDDGWEQVGRGRTWYALTLRRSVWAPVDELVPEEATAAIPAVEAHARPPQLPSEPEPRPAAGQSRGRRALLLATTTLIALAVVLGLTLFGANSAQGNERTAAGRTQARNTPPRQHRKRVVAVVPASHISAKVESTTIVATGARGDSWMEARVGSQAGKTLFAGVVVEGQTVRVTAPVVWVTFGAAGNLDVRVNGRSPVTGTFSGTITAVIAHGRVRSG
jgi:hypothetical protein